MIEDLFAVKDSYSVGRLPLAAAVAALGDIEYRDRRVAEIIANRERLTAELRGRGWEVLDSAANFVWAIPSRPAAEVAAGLSQRHVLVRHFPTKGVDHGLRITVGTWAQCQALLDAMDTIVR